MSAWMVTQVIGLRGEIGGGVVVDAVLLEGIVPQVAPQNRRQPQLVGAFEGLGDLDDLARRILGAEVDRRAHRRRTQFHACSTRENRIWLALLG